MAQPMVVGYRFHPTDEELINYYLTNKILGKTWLVNEAISELNIYNHHPESLPLLSRIKSDDLVWYFFVPAVYTCGKKKLKKRRTEFGFWKSTGKDRKITDKSGKREIGDKKTLVFYFGKSRNGVRTPWVIHEYHIKSLPHLHLPVESYVICKIKYKGNEADISYCCRLGEPSRSLVSDSNTIRAISTLPQVEQAGEEPLQGLSVNDLSIPLNQQEDLSLWDLSDLNMFYENNNVQLQDPYLAEDNDELWDGFDLSTLLTENSPNVQPQTPYLSQNNQENTSVVLPSNGGQVWNLFSIEPVITQQDYNHYKPKPSLSEIILDYSTDSDCDVESISATSYQGTSSSCDSIGSSNRHFPSCGDETLSSSTDSCNYLQTFEDLSVDRETRASQLARCNIPSIQEVKEGKSKSIDASTDEESSKVKTEKKGWFITEEAMEKTHKDPQYIYLVNIIIGFIFLLALTGNIRSTNRQKLNLRVKADSKKCKAD